MSKHDRDELAFGVMLLAAVIALLLVHARVWEISPFRDDYRPPMAEAQRGMAQGVWSFFVEPSSYPFYRPLTFMTYWAAALLSMDNIVTIIHGVHFSWMAVCLCVLALWTRALGFSRFAAAFSLLVLVTHPVLAGPLASIDGLQRLASTALTWLGAWFVVRSPCGTTGSDLAATACLAAGLGFAEYALGLVPLALLVALWRRQAGRSWSSIVRLALLLGLVVVGWYGIRHGVLGLRSTAFVMLAPSNWLRNAGQLIGVALFWGNSVWSMLGARPWSAMATAGAVAAAAAWLIAGVMLLQRHRASGLAGLPRADIGLLALATLAATFPMVVMSQVSEMYAMPVVMAVALLAGKAVEGWMTAHDGLRRLGLTAAALAMATGLWSSWSKIDDVAAAGRRSDQQLHQILNHVPRQARDWRIATVFDAAEPQPTYSVFRPWQGDWEVVRSDALAWFRPGQNLRLESLILPDACARAQEPFDLVLRWHPGEARYDRLDRGLEALCATIGASASAD